MISELRNRAGLCFELFSHGAPRRLMHGGLLLNLFPGNVLEGGPANLWLRVRGKDGGWLSAPLLGPNSPLSGNGATLAGTWQGCEWRVQWRLADEAAAWFWHVEARNTGAEAIEFSLLLAQDVGLAGLQAVTINEFYVSQYIDWQPLEHPRHGTLLAARQNQAQEGNKFPWLLLGSLRRAASYGTDGLQFFGKSAREDAPPPALAQGLAGERLQHEHAMALIEDEPITLATGETARVGFFACFVADHAAASSAADVALADATLALPEAAGLVLAHAGEAAADAGNLFAAAPMLATRELSAVQLDQLFGAERRHLEADASGPLSFFSAADHHIVLRAKELAVLRPHGHMLRSGQHLTPDERALTSTCWMGGVFHSMLTQGHVKFGRMLSTQRSYLALFRSQGLRAFVRSSAGADWELLGLPSAFEMAPQSCRWIYAHAAGVIEVTASAAAAPQQMQLAIRVIEGAALELLLALHAVIDDDDAGTGQALLVQADGQAWNLASPAGSSLAQRLPGAALRIEPSVAAAQAGDDALLYADGVSRGSGHFCARFAATQALQLTMTGLNTATDLDAAPQLGTLALPQIAGCEALASMLPWLAHNAMVHYLAPRGLEQYSGGGWGVRDVCQGPLELLLALGQTAPVRDLLTRVFHAQNEDGDWPQWFMFFARDAHIRAGDSHGDVVFWPLLGLARYLVASGDASLLDEVMLERVQRSLALIRSRLIPGHALIAYGHGDWNDALQPADPSLREQLCSAWTVTLHYQTLETLAEAYERLGRDGTALRAEAQAVQAAFQRELVQDDVVAGYAHFGDPTKPELWIHPAAPTEGLRYSLLPMMHSVLEGLLTPAQAAKQADLIDQQLKGPDGARLFDAPLPYHGGLSQRFLRAETSSFFGREIGIMYMHAHLRWAQMLAHLGRADAFFEALGQANPILINERVASAAPRQANCYYSSSDAAYSDRYAAHADYARVAAGTVKLDGGWRIYSSGPGIALSLVIQHLLGLRLEADALLIDPVMPSHLAGLRAEVRLADFTLDLSYEPGPQGAGVVALHDGQGQALPFSRRSHPYRQGPAAIARPAAGERLRLHVTTG